MIRGVALITPLLFAGCIGQDGFPFEGSVWTGVDYGSALLIEAQLRDEVDQHRVVLCDWDGGPDVAAGTFYGSYDVETGILQLDDVADEYMIVPGREGAGMDLALDGRTEITPYRRAANWRAATGDAFFGACGTTCAPGDAGADVERVWVGGGEPVGSAAACRDYCMAAAGEWLDCMYVPGEYCDCADVTY